MRKFILVFLVLAVCAPAWAEYYMTIDGVEYDEYTMEVGESVTIGVWSTDTAVPSGEPTPWSAYLLNNWLVTTYPTDLSTLTDLVIHWDKAGSMATGWANADPYDYMVNMGYSLGSTPQPVSAGLWYEMTLTCLGEGDVWVGLGWYDTAWTWTGYDAVTIYQVPEPATLALLGLGSVALIRRRMR
jgi:hypothetical protein